MGVLSVMEEPKNKHSKIIIGIIISFGCLLMIYLGIFIYFTNHFYPGSIINGIDVSGKTVEEVNEYMEDEFGTYTLKLKGRDSRKEEIRAVDIGLKYNSQDKIQDLKHSQNPFLWIYGLFNERDYKLSEMSSYDENLLKESIDNLSYFNSSNIIEPENPSFEYTNGGYVIVEKVKGNKINKDILYNHVINAILNKETAIDLEAINCYEKPQYTSESKEIIQVNNTLNKYASSIITYTFGKDKQVLDGSIINTWLKVNENLEVIFDEEKVRNYVDVMANNYDTLSDTRDFVTSLGTTVKVSDGDYGWLINRSKEVQDLITAIKQGQAITKEPIYTQRALSRDGNDIGNTYAEINLTKQYLWFYKDGVLIAEGDVVTGNVRSNHSTPAGTYKLAYKQKNAILRGDDYVTPVSFWMPFNGDIGLHDATWRRSFGGDIYKTNGSHGCINAPYKVAEAIFYNIEPGIPVVCYF